MKVVLLARSLEIGGAERQVVLLANGLAARGHSVSVALFYSSSKMIDSLVQGVSVYRLNKRHRWDIAGFIIRLMRLLTSLRPNVLHSYLPVPNLLACVSKFVSPETKIVWGIRASDVQLDRYDRLTQLAYRLEARFSNCANLIIANSYSGKTHAIKMGFPAEKIKVIPNGIDTQRFRPDAASGLRVRSEWGVSSEALLVGLIARRDPMKDHPNFLRALAKVAVTRKNVRFICIGAGPVDYRRELYQLVGELELDDRVTWIETFADMPAAYNALDVAVLTSAYGEGFPNVIGEAMACGVPCVVTDVGDSSAIVTGIGMIVPPNDPFSLSSAILMTLEKRELDPVHSEVLRENSRGRILELYSLSTLIERTERVLMQTH